jgi:hypothetical protein
MGPASAQGKYHVIRLIKCSFKKKGKKIKNPLGSPTGIPLGTLRKNWGMLLFSLLQGSERCTFEQWSADSAQKVTVFRRWMSVIWVTWKMSWANLTTNLFHKEVRQNRNANSAWITELYFQKPKKHNLSNLPHQTVEKLQKNHGVLREPRLGKQCWQDRLGILTLRHLTATIVADSGRTTPITSRRCILNIYSTNIRTE